MKRVGDVLPRVAADLGIEQRAAPGAPDGGLGAARRGARAGGARAPRSCSSLQPPALVVSATDARSSRRSCACASRSCSPRSRRRPTAQHLLELRVVVAVQPARSLPTAALDWPAMASRLALKYGLVSEEDRLSNSSDAVLVTEPTTGSKARTKGSLYLIVTLEDHRRQDARRVPPRRRHDPARVLLRRIGGHRDRPREGRSAPPTGGCASRARAAAWPRTRSASPWPSCAATSCTSPPAGDADSYLIRSARLLMPEHHSGVGLPAADNLRLDVWRGDFAVGDSLVLASRNLVEVVGTEELKNAVVTLHPQSAVEHLHHLFVAAGGEGSDAVLALEATEVSLTRVEHQLVPVVPAEPLAGAPEHSPIPLADQIAGAATAVQDRAGAARTGVSEGFSRRGRPRARPDAAPAHRLPAHRAHGQQRAETQRRAAIAVLALHRRGRRAGRRWSGTSARSARTAPINNVTEGEAALADAHRQGQPGPRLGRPDPHRPDPGADAAPAMRGTTCDRAKASGVGRPGRHRPVNARASSAASTSSTARAASRRHAVLRRTGRRASSASWSSGPDDAAYAIVGDAVVRIDPDDRRQSRPSSRPAPAAARASASRASARVGGPDLLIVDDGGNAVALAAVGRRWAAARSARSASPATRRGATDVVDIATFVINADRGPLPAVRALPAERPDPALRANRRRQRLLRAAAVLPQRQRGRVDRSSSSWSTATSTP